jgi:hypothetical protein
MPLDVVTLTIPVAPVPTTAVMLVALTTVKALAAVPPKLTAVAPVKLVPVMVTICPVFPDVGVKELIVGTVLIKIKPANVPEPAEFVTVTLPEAPFPTIAVIDVALFTTKEVAATPPKVTEDIPLKLLPVIVTDVLLEPDVGVKDETTGTESGVPTYNGLSHTPLP